MADYRSEDPDGGFKKTFVAIAIVHLLLLGGLLVAALFQSKKNGDTVVWMNPGLFGGDSAAAEPPTTSGKESSTAPSQESTPENQRETQSEANQVEEPRSRPLRLSCHAAATGAGIGVADFDASFHSNATGTSDTPANDRADSQADS